MDRLVKTDETTDKHSYGSIDNQPLPSPAPQPPYTEQQSQQVVVVRTDDGQIQVDVPADKSYVCHIILACFTFWFCLFLGGTMAFIYAGHFTTDVVYYADFNHIITLPVVTVRGLVGSAPPAST